MTVETVNLSKVHNGAKRLKLKRRGEGFQVDLSSHRNERSGHLRPI